MPPERLKVVLLMFSGIVESVQPILSAQKDPGTASGTLCICVAKPPEFNDLKIGDSIATSGVCLTVEAFSEASIQFSLAAETLKVLNLESTPASELIGRRVNLERSLRFGDRIHGHLVTGHVESLGLIRRTEQQGGSWFLDVEVGPRVLSFVWKKGSITLNGVSLTVNEVSGSVISVCLIPETIKRTNLIDLKVGDVINVEADYMARALMRGIETGMVNGAL